MRFVTGICFVFLLILINFGYANAQQNSGAALVQQVDISNGIMNLYVDRPAHKCGEGTVYRINQSQPHYQGIMTAALTALAAGLAIAVTYKCEGKQATIITLSLMRATR